MKLCRFLSFCLLIAAATLADVSSARPVSEGALEASAAANKTTWNCPKCGKKGNTGKFCSNCGAPKPEIWTCPSCGKKNSNKFCSNCGTPKPGTAQQQASTQQRASAPAQTAAVPKPDDNTVCLNVLRTDGSVDRFSLSEMPEVYFRNSQLRIGNSTYEIDKVKSLLYGKNIKGSKSSKDYSGEKQKAIYIYRNDGCFNAFIQSSIKSLKHSLADTLQVATADSTYKIPIAAVDSIGLHAFPTVYNKKVVILAPYEQYIASASVEQGNIQFTSDLPNKMKPKKGDILYSETFTAKLPEGFAGRVVSTDGYSCTTEPVGIDDVYERALFFGEYIPSEDGKLVAMDRSESTSGKGATPDDLINLGGGKKFHLGPYEYQIKKGAVTATLSSYFSPAINVAFVKTDISEPATVHIGFDVDFQLGITLQASGKLEKTYDPTIPLIPPVVIPDCPIFSVGIDLQTFAQASLSGKISAGVTYYSCAHLAIDCRAGENKFSRSMDNGSTLTSVKAEAKGELYLGLGLLPNLQLTGGMVKAGPTVYGGPKFIVTLPIDESGQINCVYDILKPAKLDLFAQATLTAKVIYINTKGERESKAFDGLNPEAFIKEWFFVPLFTEPACSPLLRDNVGIKTTASRELILPVEVGIVVKKGNATFANYTDPVIYSGPQAHDITHKFSGFEYETQYTAVPTVGVFGHYLEANPTKEFIIHPQVNTEDAINVTLNSATIVGSFPDVYNNFKTYGLKYKRDGGEWIDFKNPRQDADAFFKVDLHDLKENTNYYVQAYLIEGGKTYYGEMKSFLTKITDLEFKNPGSYHFDWRRSISTLQKRNGKSCIEEVGYYERKGSVATTYHNNPEKPAPNYNRWDDKARTWSNSIDLVHWYDETGGPVGSENSKMFYEEDARGTKEHLREAQALGYHAFQDGLDGLNFFCEEIIRLLKQANNTDEQVKKYLEKWFMGTDVVCGVKCNVYYAEFNSARVIVWVDPNTSLTLRYEMNDQYFEVTSFKIDGFDIEKL